MSEPTQNPGPRRRQGFEARRARLSDTQRAVFDKWVKRQATPTPVTAQIPRRPAGEPAELSYAQQRLWLLDQLEPDTPAYNIPLVVRLAGPLAAAALERGFAAVIRRHEVLRTTFALAGGRAVQVIAPEASFRLPTVDLSALPVPARDAESERLTLAEARRPFDLGRGAVIRATLLRLGGERHRLLLSLHHICSDTWSTGVLVRELVAFYKGLTSGEAVPLPELCRLRSLATAGASRRGSGEARRLVAQGARGGAELPRPAV